MLFSTQTKLKSLHNVFVCNEHDLQGLKVTMKKHPTAFKVCGPLVALVESVQDDPITLYEGTGYYSNTSCEVDVRMWFQFFTGPVRGLCPLAPNNVNTMACACIAAHNLGFDGVVGQLVADPRYIYITANGSR